MTVCVAVKVRDCVVFVADSATSLTGKDANGNEHVVNVYNHADKVFNLHKNLPIAAMTAGIGNFGGSSISTISKDLRALLMNDSGDYLLDESKYTIKGVAEKTRKYLYEDRFETLADKPKGAFQYWIGGISSGQNFGEIWKIEIQDGICPDPVCVASRDTRSVITWGGRTDAINRLVRGYGDGVIQFVNLIPDASERQQILQFVSEKSKVDLANSAMPTQDAIDLAIFLADTQKLFVRFSSGTNTVGGELDVATVTKHEGFKWINRKHYYTRDLNPLETDHVKIPHPPAR